MPRREHDEQERNGSVHEKPAMQPVLHFRLQIEHAPLVAPRLNFFDAAAVSFRDAQFDEAKNIFGITALTESQFVAAARRQVWQNLLLEKLD